jgi:hypothetical protein
MDILTAEEKLAAWVGKIVKMPDKVYRTALPAKFREGFEVNLVSGVPAGMDRVNEFTVEIKGFAPEKNILWERFQKIFEALPLEQKEGFLYVDLSGKVLFNMAEKEGMRLATAALDLTVSFV